MKIEKDVDLMFIYCSMKNIKKIIYIILYCLQRLNSRIYFLRRVLNFKGKRFKNTVHRWKKEILIYTSNEGETRPKFLSYKTLRTIIIRITILCIEG